MIQESQVSYFGEVTLKSQDNSGIFHRQPLQGLPYSNELEVDRLNNMQYLNGFVAGIPVELIDLPQNELIPFEVEPGNDTVKVTYRDGGYQDKSYEVIVYLITETIE